MYDLLGREVELREKRQTVLARTLEIQEVVTAINLNIRVVMNRMMIMMMITTTMTTMILVMMMTMLTIAMLRWRQGCEVLPNM